MSIWYKKETHWFQNHYSGVCFIELAMKKMIWKQIFTIRVFIVLSIFTCLFHSCDVCDIFFWIKGDIQWRINRPEYSDKTNNLKIKLKQKEYIESIKGEGHFVYFASVFVFDLSIYVVKALF